jgi:hypothetical protein
MRITETDKRRSCNLLETHAHSMLQSDEAGRVTGTVSLLPQTNRYW